MKPTEQVKTLETLDCPVEHNLLFCRTRGYGKARNKAASQFGNKGLMLQLNDDLIVSSKLWKIIESLQRGEFILTHEGEHLCSRVFAIHLEDFWKVGGCDENIRYCFEDGDFAYRAQQAGLKLKVISPELAAHINHPHAFYNPKRIVPITWEFCHMYVKYKRLFDRNPLNFYFPFHDYKVVLQHLILRVTFTIIWVIKGVK